LQSLGCDHMQGGYFSAPRNLAQLQVWLHQARSRESLVPA